MNIKRKWIRKSFTATLSLMLFATSVSPSPAFAASAAKEEWEETIPAVSSFAADLRSNVAVTGLNVWNELVDLFTDRDEQLAKEKEIEDQALYTNEKAPVGEKVPAPKKVKELVEQRDANTKVYKLSDGRLQKEVTAAPVHYQDPDGDWKPIDEDVQKEAKDGFVYHNASNTFNSFFGNKAKHILRFEQGKHQIDIGAVEGKDVTPVAKENRVTYPDIWQDADLLYDIGPDSLKETIELKEAPKNPSYSFTLSTKGLEVKEEADGSIAFMDPAMGRIVYSMPKPFMMDSEKSDTSPHGYTYSEKVTQSLTKDGDKLTVTLQADADWLRDPARKYPVKIDPTIEIAPTPTQSADTYIDSGDPDDNYNKTWQMKVGTGHESIYRGLVKFDTSYVPKGVNLDEATLSLYYDQTHTTNNQDVPITVHRVQEAWDPDTVSWKLAGDGDNWKDGGAFDESPITYIETIDNEDENQTATKGTWPLSDNVSGAYKGTYQPNGQGELGATFTWVPHLKERGTFEVQVRYTSADDRATNAPYTIYHAGGKTVKKVNQQKNGGKWVSIGSYDFDAGSSHKIVLDDDANGYVIADAVRLVKVARTVKKKDTNNLWHEFPVTSVVQDWLDGTKENHGFLIKSESNALEQGGPIYSASQHYDETHIRPKLTLIYDEPSVTLDDPTTLHGTGAELKWSKYDGDDFVEYQIHRSTSQQFLPDESTLIAPIEDRYQSGFTDTTAEPTPADAPTRVGNAYYYMVAVKTKDGKVHPSGTVIARLPKAGMTRVIRMGAEDDTTLSDEKTTSNLNHIEGEPNLMVGNNSSTYGNTRAVLNFDLAGIPKDAKVLDAEMELWAWYMYQSDPKDPMGTYQLHALNKSFTETSANWKSPWSKDGGDYDSDVIDEEVHITNDPRWRDFDVTTTVGDWVNGNKAANGFLLAQKKEANVSERVLFLSSEARERTLRPRLEVIYTTPTADNTYHAPDLPGELESGDDYEIDVTVTNTTDRVWKQGQQSLAYRWAGEKAPQGVDRVEIPKDLSPGEVIRLKAKVHAPQLEGKGAYRETRALEWDLIDHDGKWLSENANGIPALSQPIVVAAKDKADRLGEEDDQGLISEDTGGGTELVANLFEGNTMFDYTPFANPSKGFDTVPQLTYNSKDFSDSLVGPGWSFALTNMMRLGTPSTKEGVKLDTDGKVKSGKVSMVDGDGTQYLFTFDTKTKKFKSPKGTHLYLKLLSIKNKTRQWQITAKDGTQYTFDREGYITEMVDRNGMKLSYAYETKRIDNHNVKMLRYLTDSAGRRTVKLEYYSEKDANKEQRNQLKRLTDISGLKVAFAYDDEGRLTKITEGEGKKDAKVYQLSYEYNLIRTITDPKGNTTRVYYDDYGHMTKLYDREDKLTTVEYRSTADSDEKAVTIVTDPKGRTMATTFNDDGKPVEVVNAANEKTTFTWDDDLNLTKLTEPGGAVTTWTYDEHGNALTKTDAINNAKDEADRKVTKMAYTYKLDGNVADLVKVTSPEGRVTTYDYDEEGNLTSATSPKGNATTDKGDFTTSYTYASGGLLTSVKDAKGNVTKYSGYDANGSPQTITDAEGNATKVDYGERGEVLKVTDAEGVTSTMTYDGFLRPLTQTMPKEKGKTITIPAPTYDANDNVLVETSPNKAKVTYTYNKNDWVTSALLPADKDGGAERKVTYSYDDAGNLIKETAPKGNATPEDADDFATKYVYDQLNRIQAITNSKDERITYTYDHTGNLIKVTEPKGNQTEDPEDYTTTTAYDLNHQAIKETDTKGNSIHYTYNDDGLLTQVTDEQGNTTKASYDSDGNLITMQTPHQDNEVNTTKYEYDEVGNLTKTITPRGVATPEEGDYTHETVYDKLNRVKEVLTPRDPHSANARFAAQDKLTYSYDKLGRITKISAPASEGQSQRNDTTIDYYDNGWIKRSMDPHHIQTTYDYNDLGQPTQRTLTGEDGSTDARKQTWDYYPDGKLKAETDQGMNQTSLILDNTDGKASATGDWTASTNVEEHQGTDYLWNHAGDGEDTFTWKVSVPEDGEYNVYVKYQSYKDRATDAPYTISFDGGTDTQLVNQQEKSGEWVKLGSYNFRSDKEGRITLTDEANGTVIADAVKLERVGPAGIIVDNLDEANESTGDWTSSTSRPERFGKDYLWNHAGDGEDTFTWNFTVPENGEYYVYVKYQSYKDRATDAPYTVTFDGGTDTQHVNQQEKSGEWIKLGAYDFRKDKESKVTLTDEANGTVIADAVKLERVGSAGIIVDNLDETVQSAGEWNSSDKVPGFNGKDYFWNYKGTGEDTFTWPLSIPEDGDYDVYVRYLISSARATDAPYTIYHAEGSTVKKVNQQENGSQWVSVGTYTFNKGDGQKITLSDDANGTVIADAVRLVEHTTKTGPEKKAFTYDYDANGNLTEVKDGSTGAKVDAYQMDYDGLDQLTHLKKIVQDQVKETIGYGYDANGNLTQRSKGESEQTYTYTERNLLQAIADKKDKDSKTRTWSYSYTPRGEVDQETLPNGNVNHFSYYADGLLKEETAKKKDKALLNQHTLTYNENGHRTKDVMSLLDADGKRVNSTTQYGYDPRDRVVSMVKTGDNPLSESVELDANSNIVKHVQNGTTKAYTYDRNRMLTETTDGKTKAFQYDTFGRLATVTQGSQLEEKNQYDGFDRLLSQTKRKKDGTMATSSYTYDAFDRTVSKTLNPGTEKETTTDFHYSGLSDDVDSEEIAGKITRSYTYAPWGERLSMTQEEKNETSYYGYNTRGDVEMLYDENGGVRGTYGYTMYGEDQNEAFTGVDKPGSPMYNPYRYTAKRWDPDAESYDMGFRNYDPSIARFDTRDAYSDASQDLGLAMDMATGSRYAFAGGNPVSYSELDGHIPLIPGGNAADPHNDLIKEGSVYKGPKRGLVKATKKQRRAAQKKYEKHYAPKKKKKKSSGSKKSVVKKITQKSWEVLLGASNRTLENVSIGLVSAENFQSGCDTTACHAGGLAADVLGIYLGLKEFVVGAGGTVVTAGSGVLIEVSPAAAVVAIHGAGTTAKSYQNLLNDSKALVNRFSGSDEIQNVYSSIKKAPQYPANFKKRSNGTTMNTVKNKKALDKLRKVESGKWHKVYKDGWDGNKRVSIHYFQSASGKVFNVKTKNGWSNQ
ncbi:DNRLRE domain-containing protein [Marininema halotolerans]|uniref:RHS repeat-associated core domain-containing protein n=1 Tax=Marininema halotolerans TaxID=1155944 RepID=A0A1I6UUH0_9BACL|nr:DNRLRE domain-containing protein [Marininema halotolerans]SFT04974.1 RHS repeat-associated core domain-containing protein [Marininema halotolerans]